ncbi:MAG: hypothetical protein EA376_04615 [Phycisphaeraceae bacterium]|nr:MAG: hypothetical protein EA376_04615 [Phycisphaeraceae bacterium]
MDPHRHPESAEAHTCPRCGYDLAGQIAAWTHACEMQGRCPECGMGFFWGDLLSESRRRLPWLYEHARHPMDIRAALSTFARALLPNRFWRRVGPFCEVRPGRLALWLAGVSGLLFGLMWFVSAAVWIPLGLLYAPQPVYAPPPGEPNPILMTALNAGLAQFGGMWFGEELKPIPSPGWLISLTFALMSFMMAMVAISAPSFWKSVRTRKRHIARIAVYSLAGPLVMQAVHYLSTFWIVTSFLYGFDPMALEWRWWASPFERVYSLLNVVIVAQLGVGLALLTASWWFGLRRGLGMSRRNATGLAAMSLAVALFAAFIFVVIIWIDLYLLEDMTALPQ